MRKTLRNVEGYEERRKEEKYTKLRGTEGIEEEKYRRKRRKVMNRGLGVEQEWKGNRQTKREWLRNAFRGT